MTIDDEKLDELERCAEANDSGEPWIAREVDDFTGDWGVGDCASPFGWGTYIDGQTQQFCEFVAAADPPTVLSMVKEVRRLREERDRYQQALVDIYHGMHPGQGTRDVAEEALVAADE